MAATDFAKVGYDKIWALLEAHAGFAGAVHEGNRIKWSNGLIVPYKPSKGPDDFPEAALELGDLSDTAFTLTQKYAYTPTFNPANEHWTQRETHAYVLKLTHQDLRIGSDTPLEQIARAAIAKGGPRWGLASVFSWGPIAGNRLIGFSDESTGTFRLQTNLYIPVTFQFDGNAQLA
jgi:hypothetical protein